MTCQVNPTSMERQVQGMKHHHWSSLHGKHMDAIPNAKTLSSFKIWTRQHHHPNFTITCQGWFMKFNMMEMQGMQLRLINEMDSHIHVNTIPSLFNPWKGKGWVAMSKTAATLSFYHFKLNSGRHKIWRMSHSIQVELIILLDRCYNQYDIVNCRPGIKWNECPMCSKCHPNTQKYNNTDQCKIPQGDKIQGPFRVKMIATSFLNDWRGL